MNLSQLSRPRTLRRTAVVVVALAATTAVVGGQPASADSTPTKRIYVTLGGDPQHQIAIVRGYIRGAGTDNSSHDEYDILNLNGGTLRVNHPSSQETFTPDINPKTCYGTFTLTGAFTVGSGTGRFAGITGSGRYHGKGTVVLHKTSSGACDFNGEPAAEIFSVEASGTLN